VVIVVVALGEEEEDGDEDKGLPVGKNQRMRWCNGERDERDRLGSSRRIER
jgi:hypothetical protein